MFSTPPPPFDPPCKNFKVKEGAENLVLFFLYNISISSQKDSYPILIDMCTQA